LAVLFANLNFLILNAFIDDSDAAVSFREMYGITFPTLLDINLRSSVGYGLTNVPSLFLVRNDRTTLQTVVGFDKLELERLNSELAMMSGALSKPLFTAADQVPLLRPG